MYHNIILRAIRNLHGLPMLLESDVCETSEFLQNNCQDTFQKALRVRASKAMEYFSATETLPKLFLSSLAVTPMEKVMFQFMHWQKTEAYLRKINPPLVAMSHSVTSPVCKAIRYLCKNMTTGALFPDELDSLSILEVATSTLPQMNSIPISLMIWDFYETIQLMNFIFMIHDCRF